MWRKNFVAALGALALMTTAAMPALAGEPDVETEEARREAPAGYYIWRNEDGWHLRTHGPGEGHHFTAWLHTNGSFEEVSGVQLEDGDEFSVAHNEHAILLDFHTYRAWDGVDFQVDEGRCIRFRLELNGELISPRHIYLGQGGRHPEHNPFGWCRR